MLGSVTVAAVKEWSISGCTIGVLDTTAFGDTVKTFITDGIEDPGTLSFSGNYDPADTNGQRALATTVKTGALITNLYLYANTSTFWRVASGGGIIVTKAEAITFPRSGLGSISFEGQVSTKHMECVGTGS